MLSQRIEVEIAKRKAYTKSGVKGISRPSETRSMRTYTQQLVGRVIVLNPCIRSRRWRQQKQTHKPKERW